MFLCCLVECGVMEVSFVSSVLSFVIVLIIVARDTAFSFLFTCRYLAFLDLLFFHDLICLMDNVEGTSLILIVD